MKNPLVSVIITTKNEEKNIKNCLESIKKQTYKNIEIIVVDNNSTDSTQKIVTSFKIQNPTSKIFLYNKGPERSAQRNYGAEKTKGEYLLFLDADMILTSKVVEECLRLIEKFNIQHSKSNIYKLGGIIIPEESFGTSWWAKAKALERSFYVGNDAIEAARFYRKGVFRKIGGFDENLTGPEDWDFSQRVRKEFSLGRIKSFILHNEGNLSLFLTIKKKYYYSKKIVQYIEKGMHKKESSIQVNILQRYWIFLAQPKKLFQNPLLGISMLFMKTAEFVAGGIGLVSKLN